MANTPTLTTTTHEDLALADLADENAELIDTVGRLSDALEDAIATGNAQRLAIHELLKRLNEIEQRERRARLTKREDASRQRQAALAVQS